MTTFWLSTHLHYACRHSGACCTSRWPIPIERLRAQEVQRSIDSGLLEAPASWYRPAEDAPPDVAGVLAVQASGACVFHRPSSNGGCVIHASRPSACQHFPYVCVIDPRGVHVTLSHYCPTAAAMLFDADGPARIVAGPPVFADGRAPEGLDASESLPPAASASRLLSWDEVTAWEAALVTQLSGGAEVVEPSVDLFDAARAALLPGWEWPDAPSALARTWRETMAPVWPQWAGVVSRYLAAKAHASWAMYLGSGLADVERHVQRAAHVLQVEAVRECLRRRTSLDRATLTTAIRQADLLLVHLADPQQLHRAAGHSR